MFRQELALRLKDIELSEFHSKHLTNCEQNRIIAQYCPRNLACDNWPNLTARVLSKSQIICSSMCSYQKTHNFPLAALREFEKKNSHEISYAPRMSMRALNGKTKWESSGDGLLNQNVHAQKYRNRYHGVRSDFVIACNSYLVIRRRRRRARERERELISLHYLKV